MSEPIIYGNFSNGIGISAYSRDFFDDMANVDLMTEAGTIRCNKALAKDSGDSITDGAYMCIAPGGRIFIFYKNSGTIMKRDSNGTYAALTANQSNTGGHYGCYFYDNWVYFWTKTRVGRRTSTGADAGDDSKSGFAIGDNWHPCAVVNKKLFIGDGQNLAMMTTTGAWTNDKIVLEGKMNILQLVSYGYDLLIFTDVDSYLLDAGAFRYDTSSVSWASEDYIDERGINYVVKSNNTDEIYLITGSGNIYLHNGVRMQYVNKLRGVTTAAGIQLSSVYNGKPVFAIGGTIYSLVSPVPGQQLAALNKEYVCSAGSTATIHSLLGTFDNLYVAWQSGATYGIDKIGTTYATATVDTPICMQGPIKMVKVYYSSLPAGTSIGIQLNPDGAGWSTAKDVQVDAINKCVQLKASPGNKRTLQARITMTPSNTGTPATPVVQYIEFIPA